MDENHEEIRKPCGVCEELARLGYIKENDIPTVQKIVGEKVREAKIRNAEQEILNPRTQRLEDIVRIMNTIGLDKKLPEQEDKATFIAEVTPQMHIIISDAVSKLLEIKEGYIVEASIVIKKRTEEKK